MANNDELVEQFVEITKDTEERARFFLEANNWTFELALTQYYMSEDEDGSRRVAPPELVDVDEDEEDSDYMPPEEDTVERPRRSTRSKKEKPTSSSNVVTLNSMVDSDSDEEEEQGQAFYAGGSERSGQQVLGPPKKNPIKDYVSEIFRSAQESGAEVVDPHSRHAAQASSSRGGGGSMYAGAGYRLGMTDNDHTVLPGPTASSSSAQHSHHQQRQAPEVIIIKLWSNGLSINDGPLRPYDEPENQSFLNSIKKGEIPTELRKHGNAPVHVDLEDHRKEEYKAPKRKVCMFAGEGHMLGSPAPNVTGSSEATSVAAVAAAPAVTAPAPDVHAANEAKANAALNVDAGQPNTMIQIRLADGSRVAGRFNHSHTVEDIRQFINVARPTYAAQRFILLTTFPSKELQDGSMTVKDAGLLNAALMQRLV